jgi:two-component system phosphate regulon response regulator PhoB
MSAKILIIEDETEIRQFFELLLGRDGYQVRGASSAEMGLTLLQEDMPDLIVLDWMLPGMSGLEFVGKLHQDGHLAPPVLMVTARADNASVVAGLKAGADDYLTKPFDPSILRVRVEALLRRIRRFSIRLERLSSTWARWGDTSDCI